MVFLTMIGHFGLKKESYDGQTIKTRTVFETLSDSFPSENIRRIDTHGAPISFLKAPLYSYRAVNDSKNVIILLGQNGLRVYLPLLNHFNKRRNKSLYYVVIGGWLPSFLEKHKGLIKYLSKYQGIFVETESMKNSLNKFNLKNVSVVPNCKKLQIIQKKDLIEIKRAPFRICTFSRVMKEKGIEEAVFAVTSINKKFKKIVFELDIYGQIDSSQQNWFNNLKSSFPSYVRYAGIVPSEKSVEVLANYFFLLFPTYYEGEGFAGTLIDAMAAGLPVIASDWKYNSELVKDGETGLIYTTLNNEQLVDKMIWASNNLTIINDMRLNCLRNAIKYLPQNALKEIITKLSSSGAR